MKFSFKKKYVMYMKKYIVKQYAIYMKKFEKKRLKVATSYI